MFSKFGSNSKSLIILFEAVASALIIFFSAHILVTDAEAAKKPNILFVIMDDIGIDQFSAFGYGGATPARTPVINTIANSGIKFRNTWSMPECSNGRMALLTGRYPFRTNVYQAIGERDLANSHASPYDVSVPKMLKQAGYKSALFGKYHLGGPENNEAADGAPASMGWDYFHGWTAGLPGSIDTTAGGAGEKGKYLCGYVPSTARAKNGEGADSGACYVPTGNGTACTGLTGDTLGDSPGLACMNIGGILVPNGTCQSPGPGDLDFLTLNSQYVSPLVINNKKTVIEVSLDDPKSRNYRSSIEVNAAIAWINRQKRNSAAPWMATVSFTADHTPLQTPPGHLLSVETRTRLANTMTAEGTDCSSIEVQRVISDAMIEAMDSEIGRLLVSTGLATKVGNEFVYNPKASNTMIVIVDDNGSFVNTVKLPFDPSRSKATPYQTGVWVPLIVAGPMVARPGGKLST